VTVSGGHQQVDVVTNTTNETTTLNQTKAKGKTSKNKQ
jgi:hypothetical protein